MDWAKAGRDAIHRTAAMHSAMTDKRFMGDLLVRFLARTLDRDLDSHTAGRPESRDVPLVQLGRYPAEVLPAQEATQLRGRGIGTGKSSLFHETFQ